MSEVKYFPASLQLLTREQLGELEEKGQVSKLEQDGVVYVVAAVKGG